MFNKMRITVLERDIGVVNLMRKYGYVRITATLHKFGCYVLRARRRRKVDSHHVMNRKTR